MFPSSGETDVSPTLKSFAYEYVIDAFDVNRPNRPAVESAITGFSFFTPREAELLPFHMIDVSLNHSAAVSRRFLRRISC